VIWTSKLMNLSEIDMSRKESQSREDKQSLNEWREVVESVAAFATSQGGIVRIGVGPKGEKVGTQLGKGTLEDLSNKIKQNTDPPQYPSIMVEGPEESAVIEIHIEESPIKPVWAFGRPLKRVGRTNQHLSREEAQRLVEATTGRTWDALALESFQLKEVSKEYVNDFQKRVGQSQIPLQTLLRNLSLMTSDGKPCNGVVLLFGKNPQQYFSEAQVQCARFAGSTSVRFLDEMTIEGNLFHQLEEALKFVARNTRHEIRITGKPERETIPEYPEAAIREAVTNAICHREYSAVGAIQVRIYDDRLEVWNPGTLPPSLTIESLYREHPSLPRNPKIASAFYRARLIEHWGTGTLRMADACQRSSIKLEFLLEQGYFIARFVKSEIKFALQTWLKLNERQRKGLEYARKQGQITNRDYQDLCDISRRQALKDLNELVEKNLLIKDGKGRAVKYILSQKG
jgi:ATP-dependent DNA helicase RecG